MSPAKLTVKEFVISRTFDASRELVWKACTEAQHMREWFSPKGSTVRVATMDFRPGGSYHYCLQGPDGNEMWGKAVYREIVPPERLVYINSFSDEKGGLSRHPMAPTWPIEMLTTYTFTEHDGKTTLTITWIPYNASEEECKTFDESRDGMTMGWTGSLDQLEAYLAELQK